MEIRIDGTDISIETFDESGPSDKPARLEIYDDAHQLLCRILAKNKPESGVDFGFPAVIEFTIDQESINAMNCRPIDIKPQLNQHLTKSEEIRSFNFAQICRNFSTET